MLVDVTVNEPVVLKLPDTVTLPEVLSDAAFAAPVTLNVDDVDKDDAVNAPVLTEAKNVAAPLNCDVEAAESAPLTVNWPPS